ncbi:family 43 glycosylhydrolase [Micromonospora sp. KC213]|uniref:family 43 glycosylhydrolase n=1 Tax=Micromonospora sp. KC213 TaxID=2530378 RepID=UPI001404C55B|nr:family 43 glycosylhydrolase [Micromonospora sp. KC213]
MPPPAGYLIPPTYRTHRPQSRSHADGSQPFNLCSVVAAGAAVGLPEASAATTRYEAETSPATCEGTIDSDWSGYSGSGFCNTTNATGAAVQFTVNVATAGSVTLGIRFANGTTTRPASLAVNGTTVQTPSFEGTGAWSTWVTKNLTVNANAGSNTIRLAATTSNGLPNVDHLEVGAGGPTFTNPVVGPPNSADPTLVFHNGFYYYVATTWTANVVMRRSATIAGLRTAAEQVVVRTGGNTMWAPHLELIDNRWYLYYSVEQGDLPRRTHVAESAGADPLGPYTIRGILNLMPNNGWAIDAAPIRLNNTLYMTFSAFGSDRLQSLFIAPMTNPWTAAAFGSRISAPTLAWERQEGAVNEGSFLLQHNGRTFLTYSASYCGGPNYKIGMLEYRGGDPLAAGSWTKFPNPIFQRNDANGVYGPGHHSFFTSPDGIETWIAYHANSSASQGCGTTRTTRVQKVSWNADGTPNLGTPVRTGVALPVPSGE